MSEDLLEGLRRFRDEVVPARRELYERLAQRQEPRALFIGCSDSRVMPGDLTGLGAGELFVVRNVANIVPPWDPAPAYAGTTAAIEFAVSVLEVPDAIVCGHSACGGVAAMNGTLPEGVPHLGPWLALAREAAVPSDPDGRADVDLAAHRVQRNVALSVKRLLGYPAVVERVEQRRLKVHGWYYDIGSGRVDVLDHERERFVPLD